MGTSGQETHRPGTFKKPPKPHKTGRHRSKGAITKNAGGRISVKKITKHPQRELSKADKRNQMRQNRSNQRKKVADEKRLLKGEHSSPILVVIIPLQEDLDVHKIVNFLTEADPEAVVKCGDGTTHISSPNLKQRFSIAVPPQNDFFSILDLAKVANTILFVTSAAYEKDNSQRNEVLDSWGEQIIQGIAAQGLPTSIVAVTNLQSLHQTKRQAQKNHIQKSLFKWLPEEKIMDLSDSENAKNILRIAGSQKQKSVTYRSRRSYLLAEDIQFQVDDGEEKNFGTLKISGYLQGLPLSADGLVHIPGFGDYQMSKIEKRKDPFPLARKTSKPGMDVEMNDNDGIEKIYTVNESEQESLESEVVPDPMDAEQTWPTKEELAEAKAQQKRTVKLVPKGTSAYQAAWILDADEEEYVDGESDDEKMTIDKAASEMNSDDENSQIGDDPEEYETVTISETNDQNYDEKMDLYEEKQALLKVKEAKQDSEFPDEVDTPQDMLAKDRFQKYRALESFRKTFWDRYEELPHDYSRIFQFKNINGTRRRIVENREYLFDAEDEGAQPGSYITIHVKGISKDLYDAYIVKKNLPLIVFGILKFENKMSVLNFVLRRTLNSEMPIRSKERLIFQCGFRRFATCPIFSQHTNGSKHKFERFFQPNSTVVATTFAPIMFPPCPVLCYQQKTDGSLEMVATGSLLSVNPDRLVVKRVILSGHPFKVNKKSAVVRFMFFNREDIRYFKPVKLRTKYGRKGHIKEPLGTHGHMKCVFDGQLKSQDTVLMNLYKRVYPKWTYEPLLVSEAAKCEKEATDNSVDVQME